MTKAAVIGAFLFLAMFVAPGQGPPNDDACIKALSGYLQDPASTVPPVFPEKLDGVTLELFGSGCLGPCPSFKMTVRKDRVEFEGYAHVKRKGKRKAKMLPGEFQAIVRGWVDGKLYAMRDNYCGFTCNGIVTSVSDVQESSVVLDAPKYRKGVYECFFATDGKAAMSRPPEQYYEFVRTLRGLAKAKGFL